MTWSKVQANPVPRCLSDDGSGQPQRTFLGETRRHAILMQTGGTEVREVCRKESRHDREPRKLDDQATTRVVDQEFVEYRLKRDVPHGTGPVNSWQRAEPSPNTMFATIGGFCCEPIEESSSGYSRWRRTWTRRHLPRWSWTSCAEDRR